MSVFAKYSFLLGFGFLFMVTPSFQLSAQSLDIDFEQASEQADQQIPEDSAELNFETDFDEPSEVNIQNLIETPNAPEAVSQPIEKAASQPETSELNEPAPQILTPMPSPQEMQDGSAEEGVVSDVPSVFYDANDIIPQEFRSRKDLPAMENVEAVSPKENPASKFVSVQKDSEKSSVKSRMAAAERAVKLGRYEAALRFYNDLYDKNPRDLRVLSGRAMVFQKLGQIDSAIGAYQEVLDLQPDDLSTQINMLGLMTEQYPSVALRRLLLLHKENQDNIGIIAQIAVAYGRLGSFADSMEYFDIAASMEPQNPVHVFNMAIAADRTGDIGNAIEFYEKALEIDAIYGKSNKLPREDIFERLAALR